MRQFLKALVLLPMVAFRLVNILARKAPPPLVDGISFAALIADHLIENFLCKLKEFKRIAMRADKTDQSFDPMILLARRRLDESQQALAGSPKPLEPTQLLIRSPRRAACSWARNRR
jgi:hypothetical protein